MERLKVDQAISICRAERAMRERVFRQKPSQQSRKVHDMDLVLEVLRWAGEMVGEAEPSMGL